MPHTQHSTIRGKCSKVCHLNCGLDEINENNVGDILGCSCFNGRLNCSVCGCDKKTHYHSRLKEEEVEETLDEEIMEIKNKYLDSMNNKDINITKMSDNEIFKKGIQLEIDNLNKTIMDDCIELKKICKNYNLNDELLGLIIQLKEKSQLITTVEARKTCDDFINTLTIIINKFNNDNIQNTTNTNGLTNYIDKLKFW